ncbi:uncharacterized protein LOC121744915 [Salvia splendens]|uniref:uncharacterized protein LOC121744915 n=1 Tax=Salvia splendens TaxID=180675 RepID=UPI001103E67C|nr:uncharacterized protein LOC121744915 [Salvia splendens]XP_041994557.1 uncharacterized protein LOC121744915 [Salvia splendens]
MDRRLIKPIRAPLLLKDHLLDDMSSCSSNGFKSFPRRQCCTAVRLLDARNNTRKPPSLSALQSVIAAVKRLQFGAAKEKKKKKKKKVKSNLDYFLPRSFSKRLFRRGSFWRRQAEPKEIQRWKSFDELMKEDDVQPPSDRSNSSITTTGDSSDFTVTEDGNSSSEVTLNLPPKHQNGVVVGAESTTCSGESSDTNSSTQTKKQWTSDQEKDQFSPVSVLDCPFDEEDEVSSPFQHRLALMEGTRKKLLKKIQRFECLAKLEPVNLTTRFASQTESDNESSSSPLRHSSTSLDEEEEEDIEEEDKAIELLGQVKAIMPSYGLKIKADKLMLDFFREKLGCESLLHDALVEIARDWMNGHDPLGLFMEWEVEKNRPAYLENMENVGEWKRQDQENGEVVSELEIELYDALLNEVLLDIIN